MKHLNFRILSIATMLLLYTHTISTKGLSSNLSSLRSKINHANGIQEKSIKDLLKHSGTESTSETPSKVITQAFLSSLCPSGDNKADKLTDMMQLRNKLYWINNGDFIWELDKAFRLSNKKDARRRNIITILKEFLEKHYLANKTPFVFFVYVRLNMFRMQLNALERVYPEGADCPSI